MENEILASFPHAQLGELLPLAFEEDLGPGDVTSLATISKNSQSKAQLISKDSGVLCGTPVVKDVLDYYKATVEVEWFAKEGQLIEEKELICEFRGNTQHILSCERIILNFMQFLSGVASSVHILQSAIYNSKTKILDTRKTLPGYRKLQKYAVLVGGGLNHRQGLYDHILIKDNHNKAAGGARQAVDKAFESYGNKYTIECEVETLEELKSLKGSEVNWIMLDNMDNQQLEICIQYIRENFGPVKIEASGNMSLNRIKTMGHLDLDYISVGAVTHSVKAFDFSLKFRD